MTSSKHTTDRAFAALGGLLNVGVLALDAAANLVFANPPACNLLGGGGEDALKSRWAIVATQLSLAPERLPRTARPLLRAVDYGVGSDDRFLRVEILALDSQAEAGWVILLKDRKIVDVVDASLLQASRMHTQAYLHEAFRHDLKTPLNSMHITLELLAGAVTDVADGAAGPADERTAALLRYVNVLREDVARLNRNLYAAVGQPLSPQVQSFDLGDALRETAARLESQGRRQGVTVHMRSPADAVTLYGAEDWLKQALLNVAVHSLEAMPGNGSLGIECDVRERTVMVIVRDEGPGIPEPARDEIYGVSFKLGKSPRAMMGLYLARVVVESFGGVFRVETEAGRQGTSYRLLLPRDHAVAVAGQIPGPAGESANGG